MEAHSAHSRSCDIIACVLKHLPRRSVVAVSLATVLVLAACGSSDPATSDSTATESTDVVTATEGEPGTTDATPADTITTDADPDTVADGESDPAGTYLGSYSLMDEEFGTMTTVTVDGSTRTIQSNALPDHETGEFPNEGNPNTISEQDTSYEYPVEPNFVGAATLAMTPGVAVNGVKFEPGTAESVSCEGGESYRVEALQGIYNLGLDFNNAHVQPTGEYHYHGVSELLPAAYATDDDLVHVGFAADGYLIYYSKSSTYASGYELSTEVRTGTGCVGSSALRSVAVEIDGTTPDGTYTSDWVHSDDIGDLDQCNGVEIDGEYAYLITDDYPYVGRCLNGEFTATSPGAGGPPPGGAPAGGPPPDGTPAGG